MPSSATLIRRGSHVPVPVYSENDPLDEAATETALLMQDLDRLELLHKEELHPYLLDRKLQKFRETAESALLARAQDPAPKGYQKAALGDILGAQGFGTTLRGHKSIGAVGGGYLVVHFSAIPPSERPGIAAFLAI